MNNCELDILNHKQQTYSNIYYQDNDMNAYSSIGLQRITQEDSCLISNHDLDNKIKLIAVADGMGGLENGSIASYIAIKELLLWFKGMEQNQIKYEKNILIEIESIINRIDSSIRKECNKGGTTLSFSLILNTNTFFVNIGDSRIYYSKNKNLEQISYDHSRVFEMYKSGEIKDKNNIRFHKLNNLINSKLGGLNKNYKIDFNILSNNEYNKILLFTDGVTDCLSDNEILKTMLYNDEGLSKTIVNKALITNSHYEFNNENYYNDVYGGKDNATACCYVKRRD